MRGRLLHRFGLSLIVALAVFGCRRAAPAAVSAGAKTVKLVTSDGWNIVGDLYAPPKPVGAVILLHQRGGSATDWKPLCVALQKEGIEGLALDLRGTGRSAPGPGLTGEDAPWNVSNDIAAAVAYFKGALPVGIAGASYGANNALIYAAAHPKEIKGVSLFSPGANYHGLDALKPARAYRGALVLYHDKGDSIAGDGPRRIYALSPSSDRALRIYGGAGHGTDLLQPGVIADAATFFLRVLKAK